MSLPEIFMPIVFTLSNKHGHLKIICNGCREIIYFDELLPTHIRGVIEYDGQFIPVVDLVAQYSDSYTDITNDSCILVIEHEYAGLKLYTGIIACSFEHILKLSANSNENNINNCETNMSFAIEMLEQKSDSHNQRLLAGNHILMQQIILKKTRRQTTEVF